MCSFGRLQRLYVLDAVQDKAWTETRGEKLCSLPNLSHLHKGVRKCTAVRAVSRALTLPLERHPPAQR